MDIKQLIQLSPVPVEFVHNTNAYLGRYYDYVCNYKEYPCIKIIDCLDNHKKIAVLAHEIGHAICHEKHCGCKWGFEAEVHAFEYSLKWLLENKQRKSLRWSIESIKTFLNRYDHYTQVAEHIMKSKLWQNCIFYLESSK